MKTFYNLLHKQCSITPGLKYTLLTDEYMHSSPDLKNGVTELQQNPNTLIVILCAGYIRCHFDSMHPVRDKFLYIKNMIANPFYSRKHIDAFLIRFGKAQQLYRRLCRLVHQWRWHRTEITIDCDLLMNPITEKQYFTIAICHFGKKYLFTKSDLTKIIENALTHSPYIFAEPLSIKNPYNNLPFGKHHLYNMYFFMKHGGFVIPSIFHQYFLYNFHLKIFRDNNESFIRKLHIESMITTNNTSTIIIDIFNMIDKHNDQHHSKNKHIKIDVDFPTDVLIPAMKPYLHLFYTSNYSVNMVEKRAASHELYYRLTKFKQNSPCFGRKYIHLSTMFRAKHVTYNTCYVPFTNYHYVKNYQSCHIEIIEDNTDDEKENNEPSPNNNLVSQFGSMDDTDEEIDDNADIDEDTDEETDEYADINEDTDDTDDNELVNAVVNDGTGYNDDTDDTDDNDVVNDVVNALVNAVVNDDTDVNNIIFDIIIDNDDDIITGNDNP